MKLLNFLLTVFAVLLNVFTASMVIVSAVLMLSLYDIIDLNIYRETVEQKVVDTEPVRISMGDIPLERPNIEEPVDMVTYFDVPLDKELQDYIFKLCDENGVDAAIVVAMIGIESVYNDSAVGDGGRSFGLMQIQSKWHIARMEELGCDDLLDPYQNVTVGIDYLAELFDTGNSTEWVLMAYNGGPSYANRKSEQGVVSKYAEEIMVKSGQLVKN